MLLCIVFQLMIKIKLTYLLRYTVLADPSNGGDLPVFVPIVVCGTWTKSRSRKTMFLFKDLTQQPNFFFI